MRLGVLCVLVIVVISGVTGCFSGTDTTLLGNIDLAQKAYLTTLSDVKKEEVLFFEPESTGSLTGTGDADGWKTANVVAGRFVVTLSGPSNADFDLFVAVGRRPSTSSFDCQSISGSSNEQCELSITSTTTVYMLVYSYSGSSSYSIDTQSIPNNNGGGNNGDNSRTRKGLPVFLGGKFSDRMSQGGEILYEVVPPDNVGLLFTLSMPVNSDFDLYISREEPRFDGFDCINCIDQSTNGSSRTEIVSASNTGSSGTPGIGRTHYVLVRYFDGGRGNFTLATGLKVSGSVVTSFLRSVSGDPRYRLITTLTINDIADIIGAAGLVSASLACFGSTVTGAGAVLICVGVEVIRGELTGALIDYIIDQLGLTQFDVLDVCVASNPLSIRGWVAPLVFMLHSEGCSK